MARSFDFLLTALAPIVWGTTYAVTTAFLPPARPLTVAMLRALPAGLLLLAMARELPKGIWWLRVLVLGALNFSVFWWLLFVSAYRLPGGVAATIGAVQPLIVLGLSRLVLGTPVRWPALAAAAAGVIGVALLILTPRASLDSVGLVAGLGGALSMAAGVVLTKRWQAPVSALTFTAWQLSAGGLLLLPPALLAEAPLAAPTVANVAGIAYLALIGAALSYFLWFRGIARFGPNAVAPLGFFSPLTAVALGWAFLGETLSAAQAAGIVVVLGSVALSRHAPAAGALS